MPAIKLTVLGNTNLEISIDNRDDFDDIASKNFFDERHYLAELMEDSGCIGNNWDCLYDIGLTEAPAIAHEAIYDDTKDDNYNDSYPVDYKNLWYFCDYMIKSYLEILQTEGKVVFERHCDNQIKQSA